MAAMTLMRDTRQVPRARSTEMGPAATSRDGAKVIHSGQFMTSNPHRSYPDSSDDEEQTSTNAADHSSRAPEPAYQPVAPSFVQQPQRRGNVEFTSCIVDQSLNRLFQCLSLAYKDRAMTNPRWDTFKGLKWSMKDKIRLNNIIWREYHMQFVRKKRALVVQFSFPLLDEMHTKAEACVLEGTYWRRRYETIEQQYRQWRLFYRRRLQQEAAQRGEADFARYAETPPLDAETARRIDEEEHAQLLQAVAMQHDAAFRFAKQPKCASPTPGGRGPNIIDDPSMDFELLLSLINQPISNPDLYQPTLFPFQPNMPNAPSLIDSMDTELDSFSDLLFGNSQLLASSANLHSHSNTLAAHSADPRTFAPTNATSSASAIDYDLFSSPMLAELSSDTVAPQPQSQPPLLTSIFPPSNSRSLQAPAPVPVAPTVHRDLRMPPPPPVNQPDGNAFGMQKQMPGILSTRSSEHRVHNTMPQPFPSEQRRTLAGSPGSLFDSSTSQTFATGAYRESLDSLQPLRDNFTERQNASTLRRPNERSVSMPTYRNSGLLAALLQNKNDAGLRASVANTATPVNTNPASQQTSIKSVQRPVEPERTANAAVMSHSFSNTYVPFLTQSSNVSPQFSGLQQTNDVFTAAPKDLRSQFSRSPANDYRNLLLPSADRPASSFVDFSRPQQAQAPQAQVTNASMPPLKLLPPAAAPAVVRPAYPTGPQQPLLNNAFSQSNVVNNSPSNFMQQPVVQLRIQAAPVDPFTRPIAPSLTDDGSTVRGMKTVQSDTCLRNIESPDASQNTTHRELSLDAATSVALQQQLQIQRSRMDNTFSSLLPTGSPTAVAKQQQAFAMPSNSASKAPSRSVVQSTASPTESGFSTPTGSSSNFRNDHMLGTVGKQEPVALRPVASQQPARTASGGRHKAPFLEQLLVDPENSSSALSGPLGPQSSRVRQPPVNLPMYLPVQSRTPVSMSNAGFSMAPELELKPTVTLLGSTCNDSAVSSGSSTLPAQRAKAGRDRTSFVPLGSAGSPHPSSFTLQFPSSSGGNYAESVASTSEHKRATHISAEAKRRSHLRNSLQHLQQLIPAFGANAASVGSPSSPDSAGHNPVKVSKAVLLQEAARYISRLRAEARQDEEAIANEREAIDRSNAEIEAYQRQLPVTGVELSTGMAAAARGQRVDRTMELWNAYKDTRIGVHGWKFYVFSLIFEPFFERFAQTTSAVSEHEFEKCLHGWLDQHCGIHAIRQQATAAVLFVCSKTSITSRYQAQSSSSSNSTNSNSSSAQSRAVASRTDLNLHRK